MVYKLWDLCYLCNMGIKGCSIELVNLNVMKKSTLKQKDTELGTELFIK